MIVNDKYNITNVEKDDIEVIGKGILYIHGINNGRIKLMDESTLFLHGIVNENIYLFDNSTATIRGTVNKNIIVNSGVVDIYGVIKGEISKNGGKVIIHKDSIIKGEKVNMDREL
ncbi:TPA: hypothetical protein JRS25_003698 [Escherichia coli]|nr:hypothetical protein [Escherichia coli]HAY3976976.1 hypothetical protein [Escherichia coli]HBB9210947.1 hypothetical protein [Escherichia coli]